MAEQRVKPRMQKLYEEQVRAAMTEQFGYKNPMQVPKIEKIVINMGVGEATQDKKKVDIALGEMMAIAGQKPEAEKRGSTTSVAPISSAWKKLLSALVWNSGSVVHSTSPVRTPSRRAVCTPHQKYCACGQTTPFDGPVVPEV